MVNSLSTSTNIKIAVLGAGSWGATLARILALQGKNVALWARDPAKAQELQKTRRIAKPLSIDLPGPIDVSSSLESCLQDSSIILFCCTSQSMRNVAKQVHTCLNSGQCQIKAKPVLVSAAKGIELNSYYRMSEVLEETLPGLPVASLSGPNLAFEVLKGLPTASVIASKESPIACYLQEQLSVATMRLYSNQDLTGVELGGSLKNVIAIACGAVDGFELGTNAKAALMTRGLAEMTRLSISLGAERTTLSGLAGLGDLVATCSSPLSRNYQLGFQIAKGLSPLSAEASLGAVAEGVSTAFAVCELSRKLNVEMPIATQVVQALKGESTPKEAIMNLMNRPLVKE